MPLPAGVKVKAVRAGDEFVLTLTTTGRILARGNNRDGDLGIGSKKDRHRPTRVRLPKGVKIKAISAGGYGGLALTTTGRVLSWDGNKFGQLGAGSVHDHHTPVRVHLPSGLPVVGVGAGFGSQTPLAIGHFSPA